MLYKRADIQGLRAACVIAVCIFHAFPDALPGGFIGVDVFFVISGFLITQNLVSELSATGKIDIFRFWARRAQRLLPNSMLTLLTTLIATSILLPSYRQGQIANDLMSAAAFYSNFRFARQAVDYFSSSDVVSPVLHFWSLSLEEQFYFSFPILLLLVSRILPPRYRPFAASTLLTLITGFSLVYGLREIHLAAPFAFFDFAPRVWQLALGGLIGIKAADLRQLCPQVLKSLVTLASALTIAICALQYDSELAYPGIWAIPPTFAAAAVLCFSAETVLATALSIRSLVWIGDRSYSIYLWHFPFLSISADIWPGNNVAKFLAIAGLLVVSCATFPFEERIRTARFSLFLPIHLGIAASCIALFCGACLIISKRPLPVQDAARAAEISRANVDLGSNYADRCHLMAENLTQPPCVYGDRTGARTVYLFGDSHAAMWFNPLVKAAEAIGWKVIVRTRSGCPAVEVSIWIPSLKKYYKACDDWRATVIEEIETSLPELVIVGDYGNYYGWLYDATSGTILQPQEARQAWSQGTSKLLNALPSTTRAVILRDSPTQLKNYRDCASYRDDCGRPREAALSQMTPLDATMLNRRVSLLDLTNQICSQTFCSVMKEGHVIYQDDHHLTATFTNTLWQSFAELLRQNRAGL